MARAPEPKKVFEHNSDELERARAPEPEEKEKSDTSEYS